MSPMRRENVQDEHILFSESSYQMKLWRKVLHVVSGSIAILYLYLDEIPLFKPVFTIFPEWGIRFRILILLSPLLLGLLLFDFLRIRFKRFNDLSYRILSPLMIPRDRKGLCSATHYLMATYLSIIIFPRPVVILTILYLSLGDTVASIIGRNFGSLRFFKGTLEGSLACFVTCLVVTLLANRLFHLGNFPLVPIASWNIIPIALLGSAGATMGEVLPLGVDDNLAMVILAGVSLSLSVSLLV